MVNRNNRVARAVAAALGVLAGVSVGEAPATAVELPVPCAPGACGAMGPTSLGQATATATGNQMTVTQIANKALLNWSSFNIGTGGTVNFVQPGATSIALNRIFQASPSQIFGTLNANGQIYLINQNGIIFKQGASVSTASLVASSLNMSDAVFGAGLAAPSLAANGVLTPSFSAGTQANSSGVFVESGAQLSVASGGRIILAGQTVQNAGTLSAPQGQVILAAGQNVYLQASSDPSLRGLYVEVDSNSNSDQVLNTSTGVVTAPDGNITLVGLAVNQDGRLSATTSVASNGSIRLLARANPIANTSAIPVPPLLPQQGGTLKIGAASVISVTPDADQTTAVDAVAQPLSSVELSGRQIDIGGSIVAPGGTLTAVAAANPSQPSAVPDPLTQLRVEAGASIDLSGVSATVPVTRNLVTVDLRANELADDPLQRNGPLRGQTVVIDARVGTPIANVSGAIAGIGRTVAERLSTGGTASFSSDGDIVVASGATLNVSGGAVNYTGGYMQTTKLVAPDGSLVDIGSANPNVAYTGAVNPTITQTYNVWGVSSQVVPSPTAGTFEAGYTDGKAAGTLSFAAPTLVLNGNLVGQSQSGLHQRSLSQVVPGGQLIIGLPSGIVGAAGLDYSSPSVSFTASAPAISVADGTPLSQPMTLELPVAYLTAGGFTRTQIYSNGSIDLPAGLPLSLAPGSSLTLRGERIDIGSSIAAPGGTLDFGAVTTTGTGETLPRLGIDLASNVTLDVRGEWINDLVGNGAAPTAPLFINGGGISLSLHPACPNTAAVGGELVLGDGDQLLASGGAWLSQTGALTGGKGGSLSILAGAQNAALTVGQGTGMGAYGVNGAAGGQFALETQRLEVAPGVTGWAPAQSLDPLGTPPPGSGGSGDLPFFVVGDSIASGNGFASVSLTAAGPVRATSPDTLLVAPGAQLASIVDTLSLGPDYLRTASAANLSALSTVTRLDPGLRAGGTLSLTATLAQGYGPADLGLLEIGAGANLSTDPRGSVAISGVGGIGDAGTIVAPGGSVSLAMPVPALGFDPGYSTAFSIDLKPGAVVDVSGVRVLTPNSQGLLTGSVLNGGSVSLVADRGSVLLEGGASVRADGTSGLLDVPQPNAAAAGVQRQLVASNGGSIDVESPDAIVLAGTLGLHAGSANALGGSLSVALDATLVGAIDPTLPQLPTTPRVVVLDGQATAGQGGPSSGSAIVPVALVQSSGAGALRLTAEGGSASLGVIELRDSPSLTLADALTLSAPTLAIADGGTAVLAADYVSLSGRQAAVPMAPSAGPGTLAVEGSLVDVSGPWAFQGIGTSTLASTGDLRFIGATVQTASGNAYAGSLGFAGALTLSAGQVYPTTGTTFAINGDASSSVTFGQIGTAPAAPLSAAGSLTVSAGQIVQAGTLRAPFGSIELDATQLLTLADGSLTSVSGAGLTIPYGVVTLGGGQWNYSNQTGQPIIVTTTPVRALTLNAPSVVIAGGATIDLRGGGDLTASEFVPGTGGTRAVLDPGVTPGLYAVIPSMQGQFGPYDPQTFTGTGISVGQSVYLTGMPGFPAGLYPLLPASYASLPGAFLVRAMPTLTGLAPGINMAQADGSVVVPGYYSFGNTGLGGTQYLGFDVQPGSYSQQLATYQPYLASTFFPRLASLLNLPTPDVPANAGRLTLEVGQSLNAAGSVLTAAATGGVGASIDVAAPSLAITHGGGAAPDGAVAVDGATLASWAPASLLLGGTRAADGTVTVASASVDITAGTQVVAPEVLVVASDTIHVEGGALLASTSGAKPPATITPSTLAPSTIVLSGAGAEGAAFLSVSDLAQLLPSRPAGAGSAVTQILLDPNSIVASGGAIVVDASGGASLSGTVNGTGAAWSLNAGRLVLGASAPVADPTALTLTPAIVADLASAGSARLAANSSIDIAGPVAIGAGAGQAPLASLTLSEPAVNDLAGSDAAFGARTVALVGTGTGAPVAAPGGGTLSVTATDLTIGPGSLAISGFSGATLSASDQIAATGTTTLAVGGTLELAAPRVTGTSGATASLGATGALRIDAASGTASAPPALGAALTFSGSSVDVRGAVVAPAGLISLVSGGDIQLEAGASLDASGVPVPVGDRTVGVQGGGVSLSAAGAVSVDPTASVAVSGAGGERGGSVAIVAGGAATLSGAFTAGSGGDFSLAAQSLGDFQGLNTRLGAGGFTGDRSVRVQRGDLVVGAGQSVTANSVSLVTDAGNLEVDGSVIATGGSSGAGVRLLAGGNVAVNGALHADAGVGSVGGGVLVGSTAGVVSFGAGSTATAHGGAGDGVLTVRASASGAALPGAADPFALASLPTSLTGFSEVRLVPVLAPFQVSSAPSAADWTAISQQVGAFDQANGAAIAARLNPAGAGSVVVTPGVDVVAPGALTLGALDLSTWRFGGEPIELTVRAAGTVTLTGTISDGLTGVRIGALTQLELMSGDSASISITGGANLSSADALATAPGSGGNVVLAGTGATAGRVFTGNGTISVAAAQDVVFTSASNGVVSAGLPAAPGVDQSKGRPRIEYPASSGLVTISAGRDILGVNPKSSTSTWFARSGASGDTLGWGVALMPGSASTARGLTYLGFNWNVGSLGGGSVALSAGRNVMGISAAESESALPAVGGPTLLPGGSIVVRAGGDVDSGEFYVGNGIADLRAGGAFGVAASTAGGAFPDGLGTVLTVGNAVISLTARTGIQLEPVLEAPLVAQVAATDPLLFSQLGPASGIRLESAAGDILFYAGDVNVDRLRPFFGTILPAVANVLPSSLSIHALSGDAVLDTGGAVLFPAAGATFDLLAARDVSLAGSLTQSDADPAAFASPASPIPSNDVSVFLDPLGTPVAVHLGGDPGPALVTAGRDIVGSGGTGYLSTATSARLVAGRDINDISLTAQNLSASDLTLISAGRDFRPDTSGGESNAVVSVGGPGELAIVAGRQVDLGFSEGVSTSGRLSDPALPAGSGANVTVIAGLGQPVDARHVVYYDASTNPGGIYDPSRDTGAADPSRPLRGCATLAALCQQFAASVASATGAATLTLGQAASAFIALSPDRQRSLELNVLFAELLQSGRDANDATLLPNPGFQLGYTAVETFFPGSVPASVLTDLANRQLLGSITAAQIQSSGRPAWLTNWLTTSNAYTGDVSLAFSRIYTLAGGNISILAPGGELNVGLAVPPTDILARPASLLGIVAEGAGNVNVYTLDDVLVNASRIFTLGGGNILVWSSAANIDAGRGAKTALSAPPPIVLVDPNGDVTLDYSATVAGSGIRTIRPTAAVGSGSVDLDAPVGSVNAGDAGIGAAGNLNIAAQQVLGASNIQVGGAATGVSAETSNLGASLSAASSAGTSASSAAAGVTAGNDTRDAAAPLASAALGWLDVFVTGLGEESCRPDDLDCLKRQKRN